MIEKSDSLLEAAIVNWREITKNAWIAAFSLSVISGFVDIITWKSGEISDYLLTLGLILSVLAWTSAVYIGATGILKLPITPYKYFRFFISWIALSFPLTISFAILFYAKEIFTQDVKIYILLLCFAVQIIVASLLISLPLAQSLSSRLVNPLTVFRASKGHRWSLFGFLFFGSGISKTVPSMENAETLAQAAIIASGNVVVNLVLVTASASIMATAWQFAAKNEPSLAGDASPASHQ